MIRKEDILRENGIVDLPMYSQAFSIIEKSMDEYAKKIAIGFIHHTEWKMKDDDWLDKKGKLKSLDQVYGEFIKKLSV